MVYAILTDETQVDILLVRRRGSALWTLPSGEIRPGTPTDDLLTSYCQRQTGVAPAEFGPLRAFSLAGKAHLVATGAVTRIRAGARGRIEAVSWANVGTLQTDMDPVARVAVATLAQEIAQRVRGSLPSSLLTPPVVTTRSIQEV